MIFHYLRSVYEDSGSLFHAMSKDSAIASKFSCGERKANYIMRFGLATHFQKVQLESLHSTLAYVLLLAWRHTSRRCSWSRCTVHLPTYYCSTSPTTRSLGPTPAYVLLLDESYNPVTKDKQMDVHVRYWSSDCHIAAHYITSVFNGPWMCTSATGAQTATSRRTTSHLCSMGRGCARPLLELRLPHRGALHRICVHGPWMCTSATGAQTATSRRTTSRLCSWAVDVHVRYWSSDCHIAADYIASVFMGRGCARPLLELRQPHRGALHRICVHGPWMCTSATGAQTATSRRTTSRLFMGRGCTHPLLELRLPHRGALHHVCVHGPWACRRSVGALSWRDRGTEHGQGRASLHGCELVVSRYGSKEIKARLQLPVVGCWVVRPPHCSWCVQAWSGGQQVGDRVCHAVGVLNLQRDPP